MMFGMAAATSALDLIKTLTQGASSKSTSNAKFLVPGTSTTATAGTAASSAAGQTNLISPDTMNALFAAQSQSGTTASSASSRSDALKNIFRQLDGDSDGKISKSEFESALGAGGTNTANADSVFGKLDSDGDGSVSLGELASALKSKHRAHGPKRPNENTDPLLQALNATSSTSSGSATTDTSSASASTSATRSYSAIEQMIQRQIDTLTKTAASTSLSVSV